MPSHRYKHKTRINKHNLECWWGDDPAPMSYQVQRPTPWCQCKHCKWRRIWFHEYDRLRWPKNAAAELRRNIDVLHAIVEDSGRVREF